MVKRKYEGSKEDIKEDLRGAKKLGVSMKAYERTAKDRIEDRRGQMRMLRGRARSK